MVYYGGRHVPSDEAASCTYNTCVHIVSCHIPDAHTYTISLGVDPLLLEIQFDPATKLFPVSQIPSLSLHAPVSPSSALFVAVCSQLRDSYAQVLVVR